MSVFDADERKTSPKRSAAARRRRHGAAAAGLGFDPGRGRRYAPAMAGPLTGYRIIEVAGIGPGPFCGMMLADMGADVIRVDRAAERPRRRRHVEAHRGPAGARSPQHRRRPQAPRRRRGPAASWSSRPTPSSRASGPGVMERLGVGPDVCLARNPKLVFGRMTGWGQDGPYGPWSRPRHQLHRAVGHAGPHRPGGRGAGAAAQPGRRLRRRRHAARLRRRVRPAGDAALGEGPGDRRRHGRRRRHPDDHVLGRPPDADVRRGRARPRPARHRRRTSTTPTSAPTASTSRSGRSSRSSTPSCCASPA